MCFVLLLSNSYGRKKPLTSTTYKYSFVSTRKVVESKMLKITADMFSGRENPTSIITDEAEAHATIRELLKERSLLTETVPAQAPLGFRGFFIEALNDEFAQDYQISSSVYLAVGSQAKGERASELAERLIDLMDKAEPTTRAEGVLPLEVSLREILTPQLYRPSGVSVADAAEAAPTEAVGEKAPPVEAEAVSPSVTCYIELAAYNPGFWNNNPTIRTKNNCYNYASNKRTDTFAQPGRACGHMYTAINCQEVSRAGLCDGLHRRYNCFPDSEKPRYLICLWMAPGYDYHWGRKQKEGFWGHKPGGTAVRNTDSSGKVITNPQTANMAPYTQFCGYFYTCKSQVIR
jgi:hypothetical protein